MMRVEPPRIECHTLSNDPRKADTGLLRLMNGMIAIFTVAGLAAIARRLARICLDAALRGRQTLVP